jgi:hypothetical protein
MKTAITLFPQDTKDLLFPRFAEEVLIFVHHVLQTPALKNTTFQGMAGNSSFEFQLSQVIAAAGPPPPTPAPASIPPPPAPSAARPRPADVETAVTPQKPKRARVNPAPSLTPAAPAKAVEAPWAPGKSKAAGTALKPTAPLPLPPVPLSSRARRRRRGKHTSHGLSRCGVQLTPPAGSSVCASAIMPDMLWDINSHLKDDLSSDIILEHSMDSQAGIFLAASR